MSIKLIRFLILLPEREMLRPTITSRIRRSLLPGFYLRPSLLLCLIGFAAVLSTRADDLRGQTIPQVSLLKEFRPIGGRGNNKVKPEFDAYPGAPEIALAPLNFADSWNIPVKGPNARYLSNLISGGTDSAGNDSETPDPKISAWIYVFGQFLDHDISLEETPLTAQHIDITILPNDPNPDFPRSGGKIEMYRSTRDPNTNTIINTVAGYLDLSQLYGSTKAIAASLRNANGTLKSSYGGKALQIVGNPPADFFITGDPRVMENPELSAITILFMREHNYWVRALKAQHPNWNGDQLYDMARSITTAEYQNIIYNEFLPALIGPVLGPYAGYNPAVNAQVSQEFAVGAFRVGHSQVSGEQAGITNDGKEVFAFTLQDQFKNDAAADLPQIEPLIRNLGAEVSQATDLFAVDALRNLLFAGLVGGAVDAVDLIAIDIQRQYDVGLGSLNQTRKAIGLQQYESISDLVSDSKLRSEFVNTYGSIKNVDLFMGGLAEKHAQNALVGETFQRIIADQFRRLRTGDRFFWQNQGFSPQMSFVISRTRLSDLIVRNTDTPNLQANVFIAQPLPDYPHHLPKPPRFLTLHDRNRPFLDDGH
jgi:peroxidase